MSSDRSVACPFCGAREAVAIASGAFHPIARDYGPFDLYRCHGCHSALTDPVPSQAQLDRLYSSFVAGLPAGHRDITGDDPQHAFYRLCVTRIRQASRLTPDRAFRWIDAGAGDGALSVALGRAFPAARGLAIDQHERPAQLSGMDAIAWKVMDLNQPDLATRGLDSADLVVAVAVWEHVTDPWQFVVNLLSLTAPGGLLYLVCPDFGSLASRVMKRRWPYFSPGEHLFMPTVAGATTCLRRAARQCDVPSARVRVRRMWLPYTARYILRRFGLHALSQVVPRGLAIAVPAGALEGTVSRPSAR